MAARKMTLGYVWFSFEGRINRATYWLWYFLPVLVLNIVAVIMDEVVGTYFFIAPEMPLGIIGTVFGLFCIWPMIAAGAKRLHDRNKSGWYQLIYLIPIIGAIWAFIYLGLLKGTDGDNRFGPDPLAGADWAPDAMAQSDA
jgi:uncharacterized membrane protein YhaH (DUF805 family)